MLFIILNSDYVTGFCVCLHVHNQMQSSVGSRTRRAVGVHAPTRFYARVTPPQILFCARSGTCGRHMIQSFMIVRSIKKQCSLVSYFKYTRTSKWIEDEWVICLQIWTVTIYIGKVSEHERNESSGKNEANTWVQPTLQQLSVQYELVLQRCSCQTSSKFWSKNGLKSDFRASNSEKIPWGAALRPT